MKSQSLLAAGLGLLTRADEFNLVINPRNAQSGPRSSSASSVTVDISHLRNNRGFGMVPGDADFDDRGSAYPAQYLPPEKFTYSGIDFLFPQYTQGRGNDNVLAQGQTLDVPPGRYVGVKMLAAAETAIAAGAITAIYADNTNSSASLLVDPFFDWPYPFGGDIIFPYHLTARGIDYNRSMIFQTANWIDSSKELVGLHLPNVRSGAGSGPGGRASKTRLHIFAVSLVPAQSDAPSGVSLHVEFARSTNTWFEGTNKTQIYEATVNNIGTQWVLANQSVRLTIESAGVRTVLPGVIKRLRPGDQAKVRIGVVNAGGVADGSKGRATLVISGKGVQQLNHTFEATYGIAPYQPTYADIYRHESPPWFDDAKFGIFIHWGVYSVPGWGNVGANETYAEWYWWSMNAGPNRKHKTFEHHRDTYGPGVVYDDFIQNFTASAYNPREWVDLFAAAGAKYFVQVSKHHDGYALFELPANVSNRHSVALPPHRNLLKELFDARALHQPQLRQATYFSLPEWFHPAYRPFGFGQWPGGNATNPYTGAVLPYTGAVAVGDYVSDVVVPSMRTLAALGSEIMWCDIGGPNLTAQFAAEYFNGAAAAGRQVLINNRCGTPGDFDTPEYARYSAVRPRKWESNMGLDPYSYGYNRATPESAYLTPQGIVTSLVDIVSKNGNYLLDVGPTADGTILAVQQRSLREAGQWIQSHGEAIFNTTYWHVTPEEGPAVRFTQTADAFYIATLGRPGAMLALRSPVPYVEGDRVTVVGGKKAGAVVPSRLLADGRLQLNITRDVREADLYSWVFKIPYDSA